jgi:hypothetical protein
LAAPTKCRRCAEREGQLPPGAAVAATSFINPANAIIGPKMIAAGTLVAAKGSALALKAKVAAGTQIEAVGISSAAQISAILSAKKSVGISTQGSTNIDAKSFYVSSNDIKLGSKNATQPVLLGDNTVDLLTQLTEAVKSLASILQVQRDYLGGELVTSYNAIAGNILNQINDPTNGILAQLSNDSLKSQTTKVQ